MSEVLRAVGIFCSYAVLAVFAQSAVFTRGLGVSRLVQLVGDDRTNSWWFALLLCVTQLLVAPLAFYAGQLIAPLANRAQLRPVVYVACVAVVCIFEHLVLRAVKGPRSGQLLRILPTAAINSCVLGTVLVERTQSFTLGQSLGFGLPAGCPAGHGGAAPSAQPGHPVGVPRPARHARLHRRAGAGHLWFYRTFCDPLISARRGVTNYGTL